MRIEDALINTGSSFSTLSSATYSRLPNAPAIYPFTRDALNAVSVGNASAVIREYIYTRVDIAGVTVHYPLLVIEGLAFSILIGIDVHRAFGAMLTLDESAVLRLRKRECDVCREQRTDLPTGLPCALLTACAASKAMI